MKFSLVTTSLNEMRSFENWKADVLGQTMQPEEIVIVDGYSTDGTAEALKRWAADDSRVKVKFERCNAARGRNLAIDLSSGDHLISTDMGCRLDAGWYEAICRPFMDDPTVDVVAGAYQVDESSLKSAAAEADFELNKGYKTELVDGFLPCNRSVGYRKAAWQQLGGLPEDLTLCADDLVMSMQLVKSGLKIAYAPDAMVFWDRPEKLSQFWKEQRRYGVGMGEADVSRRKAGYQYALDGNILRLHAYAMNHCRYVAFGRMWNLLRRGKFAAAFQMPLLLYGNFIALNKGFAEGFKRGATQCQACRRRLQ